MATKNDIADIKRDMATKEQVIAVHTQVNSIETQLRGMNHPKLVSPRRWHRRLAPESACITPLHPPSGTTANPRGTYCQNREPVMTQWEYRKIHLSGLPPGGGDIDILNDAGADGWEIVGVTINNVAYLKRQLVEPEPVQKTQPPARPTRRKPTAAK